MAVIAFTKDTTPESVNFQLQIILAQTTSHPGTITPEFPIRFVEESNRQPIDQDVVTHFTNAVLAVTTAVAVTGIFTNAINITVFTTQGLNSSFNVSVFALSVVDLTMCVITAFSSVFESTWVLDVLLQARIHPTVLKLATGIPGFHLVMVTMLLTAYISLERCLCVAFPLKVKIYFTTKRVTVIISIIISLVVVLCVSYYLTVRVQHVQNPMTNQTMMMLVSANDFSFLINIHAMTSTTLKISVTTLICVCAFILVHNLNASTRKFDAMKNKNSTVTNNRSKTSQEEGVANSPKSNSNQIQIPPPPPANADNVVVTNNPKDDRSSKSKRLVKMVAAMSLMSAACYVPECALLITNLVLPEFNFFGKYSHWHDIFWTLALLTNTINSTVNMFIFRANSTAYRATLAQLWPACSK